MTVLAGSEALCFQHKTQKDGRVQTIYGMIPQPGETPHVICGEWTIKLKVNPRATLRIFTHKQSDKHDKKDKGRGGLSSKMNSSANKKYNFLADLDSHLSKKEQQLKLSPPNLKVV